MFHFLTPNYERILGKDRVLNQKIESRRMNLLDKIDFFFVCSLDPERLTTLYRLINPSKTR
jgi:hypothetical protein